MLRSMITRSTRNGSPVLRHYVLCMGGRSVARGRINRIFGGGLIGDVVGFEDLLVTTALEKDWVMGTCAIVRHPGPWRFLVNGGQ